MTSDSHKTGCADTGCGTHRVKDAVRATVQNLRDDPRAVAHAAGEKLREVVDSAREETQDIAEATERRIKEKPVQSSLIALGVGLVLGALLRRR